MGASRISTAVQIGVLIAATPITTAAQALLEWDLAPRVTAVGGAGAAISDDASAVFYNPAGIVHLPGTRLQIGAAVAAENSQFQAFGVGEFDREPGPVVRGSVYATHEIADGWTGGLGVNSPWRLGVEWEDTREFVGRFRASDTDLRTLAFHPVLAFGPRRGWSLAAGLSVLAATLDIRRFEQDPALSALGGLGPIELARSTLDTDGTAIGWNVAVMVVPGDRLTLGAHYRSGIDLEVSGVQSFIQLAPAELRALPFGEGTIGDLLDARFESRVAVARLDLPALLTIGAAYRIVPEVAIRTDLQWADWSALDAIRVAFDEPEFDRQIDLDYDDAWSVRTGAEVLINPRATIRVGYAWEDSPAPFSAVTPLLPDAQRNIYTLGAGFEAGAFAIDVSYRAAILDDREGVAFPENNAAPDGVYESVEHRFGGAITRHF